MWKGAAGIAILLMVAPGLTLAAQISDFGDGQKEAGTTASPAGSFVNLTVPAECHVRKVQLNVSTAPFELGFPHSPEGLRVLFGDRLLYEFNTTGFGGFGHQERFSNGSTELANDFGKTGGENTTWLRLPKRATVENATFELSCSGGANIVQKDSLSCGGGGGSYGYPAASAGDINGDGYEDLVVGEPMNSDPGLSTGKAYIFFGGPNTGNKPNITLTGRANYSYFGLSVAGAGDVNGDGFDDVMVGAMDYSLATYTYYGSAYIFFGGAQMDTDPDVAIHGTQLYSGMGASVAGVGDVNGDGYDDVLVGEPYNNSGGTYRGAAHLLFGGQGMDNVSDLDIQGSQDYGYLGQDVSGAGDLNGDGSLDFAIGIPYSSLGGTSSGEVDIFHGGNALDSAPDLVLVGQGPEALGSSVARAGDVNGDGFGDLVCGAYLNNTNGLYAGAAYVFFGGKNMDVIADVVMTGDAFYYEFGASVAGDFDLNGDGYADIAVGAPLAGASYSYNGSVSFFLGGPALNGTPDAVFWGNRSEELGLSLAGLKHFYAEGRPGPAAAARGYLLAGSNTGMARVFGVVDGALDPGLAACGGSPWVTAGFVNRNITSPNLAAQFNRYLRDTFPSGWDTYGNHYCDIPLTVSCGNGGRIVLRPVNVTYSYSAALPDFTDELNAYLAAHKGESDASGNVAAPLRVDSRTPGGVRFTDLNITIDQAPQLVRPIPDAYMDEDTAVPDLVDLYQYFQDDFDNVQLLNFSVVSATNDSVVGVTIHNDQYLSVDALEGDPNDNWTGIIDVVVRAEDHWGSGRSSNAFRVFVRNVNDPPLITTEPPTDAQGGVEWDYRVIAVDGDRDRLVFGLVQAPKGMTINSSTGAMTWIPDKWGRYPVAVFVSDGTATVWQNFTLVVPDRPPRITGEPPASAFIGVVFEYDVAAEDDDGDVLGYSLQTDLLDMSITPDTGHISGIPGLLGDHELRITVSDGRAMAFQNFTLSVVWPNRAPYFTTQPKTAATEGLPYAYEAKAYDDDHDPLTFSMETNLSGLAIDSATGTISGTPEAAGNYSILLRVQDGRGAEGTQEFRLRVADSIRPSVTVTYPPPAGKLKGTVTMAGTVARGTRMVVLVEFRIDSGDWRAASFNSSWNATLDTSRLKDGRHTLEVRAQDGREYSDSAQVVFDVDNSAQIELKGTGFVLTLVTVAVLAAGAGAGALLWWRKRRN
jgi:hypothetical protein